MIELRLDADFNAAKTQILQEIVKKLNIGFAKSVGPAKVRLDDLASVKIKDAKEFHDLAYGLLQGHLGLVDPFAAVEKIIQTVQKNLTIKTIPCKIIGERIEGGLEILLYSGKLLTDLLSLEEASFLSETEKKDESGKKYIASYKIDWLDWLLTKGNNIIVADYHFVNAIKYPNVANPLWSRTGIGIMSPGGDWSVPTDFSGTEDDNWITRSMLELVKEIEPIFEIELGKVL